MAEPPKPPGSNRSWVILFSLVKQSKKLVFIGIWVAVELFVDLLNNVTVD